MWKNIFLKIVLTSKCVYHKPSHDGIKKNEQPILFYLGEGGGKGAGKTTQKLPEKHPKIQEKWL